MRRSSVPLVLLAALHFNACAREEPAPAEETPAACDAPEGLNMTSCDPASLEQVAKEGVFVLRVRNQFTPDVLLTDAVSTLPGREVIFGGLPLDRVVKEPQRFFWVTHFTASTGERVAYAFAGCKAKNATELELRGNICVNGAMRRRLSVDAFHVSRRDGEAESANVSLVGEAALEDGSYAADVALNGSYAYVVGLEGGLSVVDISDRAAPKVVTRVSAEGDYWNDVVVKGDRAFIASAEEGVVLLDITNPAAPVNTGALPVDAPNVHTLWLEGDRLYAFSPAPTAETIIFDVSTPSTPVELSRFRSANSDPLADDFPHDGTVFEDHLYVNHWSRGVVVANLTNDGGTATEVARIAGTQSTSHASAAGRIDGGVYLFEGGEDLGADLRVFDVTNPAGSKQVSTVQLSPFLSIHNLALSGTRLYVAWYQLGLRVFDVSNPAAPTQAGYFNTWRETDRGRGASFYDGALGVITPGDGYIYVAESSRGLMIFKEGP